MVAEVKNISLEPPIALTTDFNGGTYPPEQAFRDLASAEIPRAHWCHEWNTGHLYTGAEVKAIRDVIRQTGVSLLDTHASEGSEAIGAYWLSKSERTREAGVNLIKNRILMTSDLSGNAVVLHVPSLQDPRFDLTQFHKSMEQLRGPVEDTGVGIALETLYSEPGKPNNFDTLKYAIGEFEPDFVGVCFDSGHWNMDARTVGYDQLRALEERIMAVHLHDNPGRLPEDPDADTDDHRLPFTGTVDWAEVCRFLGNSNYANGTMSLESSLKKHKGEGMGKEEFLLNAHDTAILITRVVDAARNKSLDEVRAELARQQQGVVF